MRRGTGWRRWAAVVGFCAAMTASAAAEATVAVPLSQAEQVGLSDMVVRATVLSRTYGWNADRSHIITLTRLRVTERYKGAAVPGAELVLRQLGGETEGLVERIPGDPRLADGEDLVVFLRNGPGVVFLTAMAQSVYHLHPAAPTAGATPSPRTASATPSTVPVGTVMARRDLDGITFARPRPDGPMEIFEPTVEPAVSLDELRTSLRSLGTVGVAR